MGLRVADIVSYVNSEYSATKRSQIYDLWAFRGYAGMTGSIGCGNTYVVEICRFADLFAPGRLREVVEKSSIDRMVEVCDRVKVYTLGLDYRCTGLSWNGYLIFNRIAQSSIWASISKDWKRIEKLSKGGYV